MRARVPAIALTIALASAARAQERSIGGVVLTMQARPLPNARIEIDGSAQGTTSDQAGRFVLRAIPADDVRLVVRAVGYQPWRAAAHAGELNLRVLMTEVAVQLEQVVTIGTADASQRRELGNAITVVDAREVVDGGTVQSLQQLLNGRVAGLAIQPSSGSVGSGGRITVRGGTSFALDNEPLLYVDGVRVNNARNAGPENQSFSSKSLSSINDLDLADIERVEVIKGPSAATLYGTEASSGVINIVTKHGAPGKARWSFTMKQGSNSLRNGGDIFPLNYQRDAAGDVATLDVVARERSAGRRVFREGEIRQYALNVGGGYDGLTYYLAGDARHQSGVDLANRETKTSGRVNLQLTPDPRLAIALDAGYVAGPTDENVEGGLGGLIWTTLMADPRKLPGGGGDASRRGFYTFLPEELDLQVERGGKLERDIGRLTTSVHFDHRPTSWLRQRLVVGYDHTAESNDVFAPRVDALLAHQALLARPYGYRSVENRDVVYQTIDYAATGTAVLGALLKASTSIGGQYYAASTHYMSGSGDTFPAEGLSSLAATTLNRTADEDLVRNVTVGGFVQEQLDWRERLFLTFALRADDNSSFGASFDHVYYPKASLSWVLSDEPFFRAPVLNTVRLRAAYGEAGKQPQAFDALRTYTTANGPTSSSGTGDAPAVTPSRIGNPNLGPERGKELEVGVDLGAMHDRVGVDLTYYNKRTTKAILQRQYAPSGGFPGTQLFNAGEIRNTGVELALHATPVQRDAANWELGVTLGVDDNRVLSLGDPSVTYVTAGTDLRHQVGYPVGSWFEKRVLSAQMDANGQVSRVLCDDGRGGAMPCAGTDGVFGTDDDAPSVFLGRSLPRAQGAATTSIALLQHRLRVSATADFAAGQYKFDGNTSSRCTFDGGRCRENFYPAEFDPRRIAGIRSNGSLVDWVISDASFAKLRELSIAYTLPEGLVHSAHASNATLTIAGRELHTWTRYRGLETEAMYLGGTYGGSYGADEGNMFPQLSQWVVAINVQY